MYKQCILLLLVQLLTAHSEEHRGSCENLNQRTKDIRNRHEQGKYSCTLVGCDKTCNGRGKQPWSSEENAFDFFCVMSVVRSWLDWFQAVRLFGLRPSRFLPVLFNVMTRPAFSLLRLELREKAQPYSAVFIPIPSAGLFFWQTAKEIAGLLRSSEDFLLEMEAKIGSLTFDIEFYWYYVKTDLPGSDMAAILQHVHSGFVKAILELVRSAWNLSCVLSMSTKLERFLKE